MQPSLESDYAPVVDARDHHPTYVEGVRAVLRATTDVWADEILRLPDGPTYEAVEPLLVPSMLADPLYHTPVPYLPLTSEIGRDSYALHLVDGSHIIAEGIRNWLIQGWVLPNGEETELQHKPARVSNDAPRYFFHVGEEGEVFGSRLDRLAEPALHDGYLPILQLTYTAESGQTFTRESFVAAGHEGPVSSWVSFRATGSAPVRIAVRIDAPEFGQLRAEGTAVLAEGGVVLRSNHPVELDGDTAVFRLDAAEAAPLVLVLVNSPDPTAATIVDESAYAAAHARTVEYWNGALEAGSGIRVPEKRVMDAYRNLILQNLVLGHRYSIGNPYERTFLMEGHLAVLPLLRFGYGPAYRKNLQELVDLTNGAGADWYESWERGTKLSAAAEYFALTGDATVLRENAPRYHEYLASLTEMTASDPLGLLAKERYAWDIPEVVYGTHSQAVAWRGMQDILLAYRRIGDDSFARYEAAVDTFAERLRESITRAQVQLEDGSLFVPVILEDDSARVPFDVLTASRQGNYWNLVAPYFLASGIIPSDDERLAALLRYMDNHGAFLLGLTRFAGLYEPIPEPGEVSPGGTAGYKVAGIDNAFGIEPVFVLADLGEADRIALVLYAKLAHGMSRGTFLDGEATTIAPVPGEYFRSSWYPPNSTSNALFLLTMRAVLLHEHVDARADLARVDLAPSTPRGWLAPGNEISVTRLPSRIGDVSYTLRTRADGSAVDVAVDLAPGRPAVPVRLHLRLPVAYRAVDLVGSPAAVELIGDAVVLPPHQHSFRFSVGVEHPSPSTPDRSNT
ncbi:MAG: hypothetical protein EAS51_11380 [Microbacteriaceae bacterium]|nr:MAG: hypothetical protein EAS51_11380 [Microbacteriaceae bacterium]